MSQLSRSGADFDPLAPPYNSLAYFKTINLSASLYIPCRKREEGFFTGIPAPVSNQIIEIIPPSSPHSPSNSTPINGCLTDDRTVMDIFVTYTAALPQDSCFCCVTGYFTRNNNRLPTTLSPPLYSIYMQMVAHT